MESISGGYFLTTSVQPPRSCAFVPDTVVTLSTCLADIFPNGWPTPGFELSEAEALKRLTELGIKSERYHDVIKWIESNPPEEPDTWPYVFLSPEPARRFAIEFFDDPEGHLLLGLSIARDLVDNFLEEAGFPNKINYSEVVAAALLKRRPNTEGKILGYEVLGDCVCEQHSLLCNGLEDQLSNFGMVLNEYGLFNNHTDAQKFAAWVTEEEQGEPVLWLPWEIRSYQMK